MYPVHYMTHIHNAVFHTWTSDMVTEMLLGWTVKSTHWSTLEAKRQGSSALSHRSLREQLHTDEHTHKIMQHVNHHIVMSAHHSLLHDWTELLLPPVSNPKKLTVIFIDNTFAGNNFYNVRLSKCQLSGKAWPHLKAGVCMCICRVQLSRVPT